MAPLKLKHDVTETQLMAIYEIGKVLAATLDLPRALHEVLNILSSYLGMRHCALALLEKDERLNLAAVTGMSLRLAQDGAFAYPIEIAQRVIHSNMPMAIPRAEEEPMLREYLEKSPQLEESFSFLCLPLKSSEKPLGVLSLERDQNSLSVSLEHDLRFLGMVANLIAQALILHKKLVADRDLLMKDNARLRKQMAEVKEKPRAGFKQVVGNSPAIRKVFAQIEQAAPTRAAILLRGESGTGKELLANAIHVLSPRKDKPFIKLNCAALSESVLESELFGHEKGAFTGAQAERKGRFELAHEGTLFLDEIGEISLNFQAKLLRVLQTGDFERMGGTKTLKVDVRLVAATNRDLEEAVAKGDFRADLYYRLNVIPIFIPALRERNGDIPLLALHFLEKFNRENERKLSFSSRVLEIIQHCGFPGNVRELENCIYRTATMSKSEIIDEIDLACRHDICLSSTLGGRPEVELVVPSSLPGSEKEKIITALEKTGYVQAKAARLLGLTPRQIGYAIKKYNINLTQL